MICAERLDLNCQIITPRDVCLQGTVLPPWHEAIATTPAPSPSHRSRQRVAIPPDQWPIIAAEARQIGLRQTARQFGISHETIRQIVRRVASDSGAPSAG